MSETGRPPADGLAHLRRRLSQYGAVWVLAFVVGLAAMAGLMLWVDLMDAADLMLPPMWAAVTAALVVGVALSLRAPLTAAAKAAVVALAALLWLPLMWAPTSAAGLIAFLADRPIEYSQAYYGFRVTVGRMLWPLERALFGDGFVEGLWTAFQVLASLVGFAATLANLWPLVRRALGASPADPA